jgi:hypothetical protein
MANVMGIMSMNVNGLGNVVKRKRVMMKLKKKRKSGLFLTRDAYDKGRTYKVKTIWV